MAGGKGERLKPFTNVLPKPLVPIHDKTIIELIIDNFSFHGIEKFNFSLNYKGNLIKTNIKKMISTFCTLRFKLWVIV